MARTLSQLPRKWFVASALLFLFPSSLPAQMGDPALETAQRAETLFKTGSWSEAAELYAELSRQQPGVAEWRKQLRLCRQQERRTRRNVDPSFQQKVLRLPLERAVQLYGEVLSKIEAHYVDEVELRQLVQQGLVHLQQALENPAFRQTAFATQVSDEMLIRYRASLPERWGGIPVTTRREAEQRVQNIAINLQQELGASPTAVVIEFLCAACEGLDEYGAYLAPDRFLLEKTLSQADIAGIGVELRQVNGNIIIATLVPDGPAARADIQVNEQVLSIDGLRTKSLGVEEASLRLLGKEGTRVRLEVQGAIEATPRLVEVSRQRFNIPSITGARIVDPEAGIGYVHLALFQASTPEEVDLALNKLAMQGLRALILDLRGNPGGNLDAAVSVADRFISDGVLVSTRGRSPESTSIHRTSDGRNLNLPLVLLIDGETASAAEIVAGAIRDHHRGVLVGQPTYGKGSVQYVYPLHSLSSGIRLTTARYYSPLDVPFQDQPVQPDLLVDELPPGLDGMESMMSLMQLQQFQFEEALRTARDLLLKR